MTITSILVVLSLTTSKLCYCELPLVLNTWPFTEPTDAAWSALMSGATAVDSVVDGCSVCEFEPQICSSSVGYGTNPDENGETTLDAMVYDGLNRDMGSVASLRGIKNAIAVARAVMQHTTHSMLVGSQATAFAEQMAFPLENLTTDDSAQRWINWKNNDCQPNFWENVEPDAKESCGPYSPVDPEYAVDAIRPVSKDNHDTIGMIVIDAQANIAVGTSTSGLTYKIPGRVSDTAVVGAGGYVDNDVGAAAATGDGDILMRFLPCFKVVEYMRSGLSPTEAAQLTIEGILDHYPNMSGGLVAANKNGDIGAACSGFGTFSYSYHSANETETVVDSVECL